MSNLSDTGLILCIAGTTISVASFLLSITMFPLILNLQIAGGIILAIAFIILGITRNEFRTVKMKNGFPLKIDHLIIFACAMSIWISFFFSIDINHYLFTGELSCFTIVPAAYLILALVFASIRIARYNFQSPAKDNLKGKTN
jgi:hypothetical protein